MPTEDLTTFTEVNGAIATTTDRCTVTSFTKAGTERLYKSYGASYFGSDFTHEFEYYLGANSVYAWWIIWGVANDDEEVINNTGREYFLRAGSGGSANENWLYLYEYDGGVAQGSDVIASNIAMDTVFYVRMIKRGTALSAEIYSDAARTVSVGSLSLVVTDESMEYLYVAQTLGTTFPGPESQTDGWSQFYDLDAWGGSADLFAEFEVGQGSQDLFAEFEVGALTIGLFAYFEVTHSEDLFAELVVQQTGTAELFAEFVVQQAGISSDLFAELTVRHSETRDLYSTLYIRHSAAEDLFAELTVRHSGTQGLFAEMVLRHVSTLGLFAEFIVRHTATPRNLYSTLYIRHPTWLWTTKQYIEGVIDDVPIGDALLEYTIEGVMVDIQGHLISNDLLYNWANITEVPILIKRATTYGTVATLYARGYFDNRIIVTIPPRTVTVLPEDRNSGMDYWESKMEYMLNLYTSSTPSTVLWVDTWNEDPVFTIEDIFKPETINKETFG